MASSLRTEMNRSSISRPLELQAKNSLAKKDHHQRLPLRALANSFCGVLDCHHHGDVIHDHGL